MGRSVKDATRPRSQRKSLLKGYENENEGRVISQFPRKSAPTVPTPTVSKFSSSPSPSSSSTETPVKNTNPIEPTAVQASSRPQQEQQILTSVPIFSSSISHPADITKSAFALLAEKKREAMVRGASSRGRGRGRGVQRSKHAAAAPANSGSGPSAPPPKLSPVPARNAPGAPAAGNGVDDSGTAQGKKAQNNDQPTTDDVVMVAAQEAGPEGEDPSTVKHAKRLLPDPTFPHFKSVWDRYWSEQDEQLLHDKRAKLVMDIAKAPRSLEPEFELWRIMIKLYDRIPIDLFRYGLRPVTKKITIFNRPQNSFNLPEPLCRELSDLLCHPIWEGKLEVVRYALQLAVCQRVAGHAVPLGPLVEIEMDPLGLVERMIEGLPADKQVPAIAEYAYRPYLLAGAHTHPAIQPITTYLAQLSSAAATTASRSEKYLFLLTAADVATVKRALDTQRHLGEPRWKPCAAYRAQFIMATGGGVVMPDGERLHPRTEADLLAWKAHCSLHLIREKQIRFRVRDEGRDDRLFDVPQRDPYPVHFMSERISPDRFRSVTGE